MYSELADILKTRTQKLALDILILLDEIQNSTIYNVSINQLRKSATSIGANYGSALRAKSKADFISKLSFVIEEANETLYWLALLFESKKIKEFEFEKLHKETLEILNIMAKTKSSTIKNVKPSKITNTD
ncbi:MAG: four helix bundle protein [bacterium]|nr:four helix bundle protein [bacterium]